MASSEKVKIGFFVQPNGTLAHQHSNGVAPVFVKADGSIFEGPVGSVHRNRQIASDDGMGKHKEGERPAKPEDLVAAFEKRNANKEARKVPCPPIEGFTPAKKLAPAAPKS